MADNPVRKEIMEDLSVLNYNIDLEAEVDLPATQIVEDRVLKDVVAYVEVRSTNDNRSEAVEKELLLLGASVEKKFTSNVTHVIFKEGRNRTKTKAQKKGVHLVSVLWVENCKLNQEHVSERMYPAVVPRLKGTPLLMTKLKKAKSMQPRDFEEELASSAERVGRKRKKLDAINRLQSADSTPTCSPRSTILVQDTQPRSPDDGFILTPIRLTIPDTPPSMREKMKKIREAREGAVGSYTTTDPDEDVDEKHISLKQLQKNLFKHDEVEKLVLDASLSKDNSSHESEGENEKVTSNEKKVRKESLPCEGLTKESKERERTGRRSNCSLDKSKASLENGVFVSENKNVELEKVVEATQTTKGKKMMKKKLMSLTDLTEPHSVLIEPTKCSSIERPQLEPAKGKRGRKKKVTKADDSGDCVTVGTETTKGIIDTKSNNGAGNVKDSKQKGRKSKTRQTWRANEEKDTDNSCAKSQKKRNTMSGDSDHCEAKKQKKTLVNETHIEKIDTEKTKQSPVAKIQDVTTQLNLTKDNSLVCSIRETTLSLSMSTAYTDANMPSFLISQRKSIDEFNASQRHNKKLKTKDRTVLASINEKENIRDRSSSDSDRSVTGRRHGRVSGAQHRKIVRPSIVMTSLHSHEQDVVISVVKKLGGFVIAENVNETTTHVICGEPRRTLNVLNCLARGAWLLTKEWVIKSLEAGEWIPEAEFECTSSFPVCRTCRLEREKNPEVYHQSLFARIGPVYISGRSQPPRQHLAQLLKLCGGQVTGVKEKASVYLGSDFHLGMTCVKTNWLLDCITSQQLLPMDRYYLDRPKRDSSPAY